MTTYEVMGTTIFADPPVPAYLVGGGLPLPYTRPWLRGAYQAAFVPGGEERPDIDPPVVTIVGPPAGASIGREQPIRLRVTDEAVLRNVILYLRFVGQAASEVVHDGCCFLEPYVQGSRRTVVADGYEFTLMRTGGWPGSPSLSVRAFDVAGNEGR